MSSKLVLQDLVDLLAKKSKITKKEAYSFFREFFQIILDSIFNNDSVKIKDFGTFKLVSVSSRVSVDVNTGEKIQIRAHYKLSFVPDKTLKNLVNKPFSQFETILLDDNGDVYTDDYSDNEEEDTDDDEKEYEIDMASISDKDKFVRKPNFTSLNEDTPEEQSVEDEKIEFSEKEEKPNLPEKARNELPAFQYPSYTTSYVYTYTTSTSKKDADSESITLSVPKKEFPDREEVAKEDIFNLLDETISQIRTNNTSKSESEKHLSSHFVNDNQLVGEDEVLSNSEEKKNLYIEPIIPIKEDNVPLTKESNVLLDDDSEIEMEEDVIIPVSKASRSYVKDARNTPDEAINKTPDYGVLLNDNGFGKTTNDSAEKKKYTIEDPERPLLPDGDDIITGHDFVELMDDEPSVVSQPIMNNTSNKPSTIRNVAYSETIDDIDIPYHDYYAPTLGSKIKKALPWAILAIVLIGFLAYNLIPMLNIRYDFENKIDKLNLSVSDTILMMDQDGPDTELMYAPDSTLRVNAYDVKNASSDEQRASKEVDSIKNITPDRKISDNLQISTINKAQEYLQLHPPKKKEPEREVTSDQTRAASGPTYDTIKRGVTLRNLATKYYGNSDYWVYIYQSNIRKIQNPNNIPIGTTLLIPELSKYGVNNPQDYREIQKAKNISERILRR